jgi:hypothetical protein
MALKQAGGRFAYTEHTAEKVSLVNGKVVSVRPVDVLDRAVWVEAMPGYGLWVTDESMDALFLELGGDEDAFLREACCVWDPETGNVEVVIPAEKWMASVDVRSRIAGPVCVAVDVMPDRSAAAVAVAGRRSDGRVHGEVVEAASGTVWVASRLKAFVAKWKSGPVVVDERAAAGGLVRDIEAAGVQVATVSSSEMVKACGEFYDDVVNDRFRHLDQPELNTALFGARKREVGDAWAWHRKSSSPVNISPLVAVTLARWRAATSPAPKPMVVTSNYGR